MNKQQHPFSLKKKDRGPSPLPHREKRLFLSNYNLSRFPKWLLFPVFDIRLSALVDDKTISINVQ